MELMEGGAVRNRGRYLALGNDVRSHSQLTIFNSEGYKGCEVQSGACQKAVDETGPVHCVWPYHLAKRHIRIER